MRAANAKSSASGGKAAQIERTLALRIFRGHYPAHSQLPSVRDLAREFDVAAPTLQRVIDRLEAKALVETRRGSGVRIIHEGQLPQLDILPLYLEAMVHRPDRAAKILSDFLELRRVVLTHLLKTRWPAILEKVETLMPLVAALRQARDSEDMAQADLRFSEALVIAAGQSAVGSIFRASLALVEELPLVRQALYGDRERYLRDIENVATLLVTQTSSTSDSSTVFADTLAQQIETILEAWDEHSVARFRALLRGGL